MRYFSCPPDSAVFVGIDKLTSREDPESNLSPKRDDFKSRIMAAVMPSFLKGKSEQKLSQQRINQILEIYQRVVTFIDDHPARGTVRYIGQEKDSSGKVHTIVGLEMVGNAHKLEFMYHKHISFIDLRYFSCVS